MTATPSADALLAAMEAAARLATALEARIIETYGGHGTVLELPDEDCNEAADVLRTLCAALRASQEREAAAVAALEALLPVVNPRFAAAEVAQARAVLAARKDAAP